MPKLDPHDILDQLMVLDPLVKGWAASRTSLPNASGDTLDQLILWRMQDPRYIDRETRLKGLGTMPQRQWTIEARADFADQEKNDAITQAIRTAAVHVHATMVLLSDGQKPQVVAFSDDFFAGHEEISLIEDTLGMAKDATADVPDTEVSDDMLAALRELPKQATGNGD